MTTVQKYALMLEYEGTHYHGWQRQPDEITVQETIEEKLAQIIGQKITIHGACRTDAGVHALAQVAHFEARLKRPLSQLWRGINALLPPDISAIELLPVPEDFHARYDSYQKTYQYRILNSKIEHPISRRFCYWEKNNLNVSAMRAACQTIIGTHDFSAFRAASCNAHSPIRTINSATIESRDQIITFTISGNGFLQYMVRIMIGTLIDIGRGYRPLSDFEAILSSRDRQQAGFTAPGHGLTLTNLEVHKIQFSQGPRNVFLF
ncbi:tRNA pseudouridine(38-40) synthase TruA [candidate division CSSED10-310 bacterium]|uniref:tRNA pseudouridine synthase A n=1 Tax=candidate division CSSED10-310 bacterium TaxID=2855610 RepID=A0ABV6YVR7_UNCC1